MSVIAYAGNAGDRNARAMSGAVALGLRIANDFNAAIDIVASPAPVIEGGWVAQLQAATPNLRLLAAKVRTHLERDDRIVLTIGRCAAGIATLPLISSKFPDAAIVWFDAHGDSNVPENLLTTDMSYLGGMVITGAAGKWETGFGSGVNLANVILVDARDLDPPEMARIEAGEIKLVSVGPGLAERLEQAIDGRRVYIHLDCDVLTAGLLATEYQSPNGLSFDDLRGAYKMLAEHDVLGIEIAEFESCWLDGRPNRPDDLLSSIQPVMEAITRIPVAIWIPSASVTPSLEAD